MLPATPYAYIQCPCSDSSTVGRAPDRSPPSQAELEDDDKTFDPRAPRSSYSLYPLEYLMYCEDCQQIRCQRCVNEEIVAYYCPNCLFEVPSSNIKSEGNRCTRSCFQCPVCVGPLTVNSIDKPADPTLLSPDAPSTSNSQCVLTCSYCNWSSTEIGIVLDKPSGMHSQLAKVRNGGGPSRTAREHKERRKENPDEPPVPDAEMNPELQFAHLKSFYNGQLSDSNSSASGGMGGLGDIGFSSPGSLSRIMSLYTGGSLGGKRPQGKTAVMREAKDTDEGLTICQLDESAAIEKLQTQTWYDTPSLEQRNIHNEPWRFVDEYRPIPTLLRTKRSKRCPVCRHIITKPEAKVANTRYRIRLVASHYVPTITIKPMPGTVPATPMTATPKSSMAQEQTLVPSKPAQYILTFKNPIFEDVKVTLGTPPTTPGRFPSKVTVLCPQFTIDANTDMWDDALKDDYKEKRRTRTEDGSGAEAGKIWERGRNWVSIVVEVVPASLRLDGLKWAKEQGEDVDDGPLREDEDILEIPMFVRIEWEAETQEVGSAPGKDKHQKEKRELAYWCVLGMGRIMQD